MAFTGTGIIFPLSINSLACSGLTELREMVNTGTSIYLSGGRSKEIGSCEVKITDGRHSDRVVGVIILHRLCCTCYGVFKIIGSSI